MTINSYSDSWFRIFMATIPSEQTRAEVAFVATLLPPRARVLDLACGVGRHAIPLGDCGFTVVGLDRDRAALGQARARDRGLLWVEADLRKLPFRSEAFDSVICMWQSFGYFDSSENENLLRQLRTITTPSGLLLLDIYNREFFENSPRISRFTRGGRDICQRTSLSGGRLNVKLDYDDTGTGDEFDWQVFSPDELGALARRCGWEVQLTCSGYDTHQAASGRQARVQYLLKHHGEEMS